MDIVRPQSPGQYYFKPMMKEFRFEPASQMITVEEGQSLNIDIAGIKTAYRCDKPTASLASAPRIEALLSVRYLKVFYLVTYVSCSCYGAVQSLSGDAERDVAVEAVGQDECSLYSEDTVTDEEGRFRLRGLLVSACGRLSGLTFGSSASCFCCRQE